MHKIPPDLKGTHPVEALHSRCSVLGSGCRYRRKPRALRNQAGEGRLLGGGDLVLYGRKDGLIWEGLAKRGGGTRREISFLKQEVGGCSVFRTENFIMVSS